MADTKFTDLPAVSALDAADVIPVIDVSAGAAGSSKITRANFEASLIITADQVVPGFVVGLGLVLGSAPPIEIGTTWTPTFNASYSPNSTGLSSAVLTDNEAGSLNVLGTANPLPSPTANYTKVAVNATETVTLTATRNGVTKTASYTQQWEPYCWSGVGAAGATTLDGATGAIDVAGGPLVGALRPSRAGVFTASPTNQKIYFACPVSYGAVAFQDQNGFAFAMNAPTVIVVTTASGIALNYNLYESTNLLATPYTVTES